MVNTLKRIQETIAAQNARIKKNGHDGHTQVSKDVLEYLRSRKNLNTPVAGNLDLDTLDQ